ncbi:hypothetical protein BCT21_15205 [Vibrio sp. 10N.222.55.F9]|nr:hypothetical protein BCT21_15205 [Vibrio sp. 10N.222.55.F9]
MANAHLAHSEVFAAHFATRAAQRVAESTRLRIFTWSSSRLKSPHSTAVIELGLYDDAANGTDKEQSDKNLPLL